VTTMKTEGFHHVTLVSGGAQRTVAFYRDLLGLRLADRAAGREEGTGSVLVFGDEHVAPGTILEVVERPGAGAGLWGQSGIHHVALGVADEAGLLRWKRRLTDAGVSVSGPYDRGWFSSIYFRDPDGQILEVATAGPGYAIDEPEDALGSGLILPASRQLRGNRDEESIRRRTHADPVPEIVPEMRLQGIHHVTGMTDDIDVADGFYRDVLGLRLVKRSVNQDDPSMPHWFWARYDGAEVAPHSSLTLFGWPRLQRSTRPGRGQVERVSFRGGTEEELERWRERLTEAGVEATPIEDRGPYRSIRFASPDGLPLELAGERIELAAGGVSP
jgi:glyoxalase family protein